MSRLRSWIHLAWIGAWLGACAAPFEDSVAPTAWQPITPGQMLNVPSISLLPPAGAGWRYAIEAPDRLVLAKDMADRAAHTVIALAVIEPADLEGKTPGELMRFVERLQARDADNPRIAVRRVENAVDSSLPATCVRATFEVLDRGAPAAPGARFVMAGGDLYCLHPLFRQPRLVHLGYSQRYPEGAAPLDLDREFLSFTQSLVFLPSE